MATILLQAAGAFLGGLFGPVGATIGTAAGALAGYVADRALLQSTKHIHGPRLSGPRPLTAEEGAPVPRLYGTARLGATAIWATRFEESRQTRRQGGKGRPKVTTYSYFVNAAFALCEGEIAGIRRIWTDGKEIDREQFEIRIHTGGENQQPDPLIEAKQGSGNTPAYRGIAYVVIERFPLAEYGNRIPQFQFEVIRPVGALNRQIRAVVLIPGATEFGLFPTPIRRQAPFLNAIGRSIPGSTEVMNRNTLLAASDLMASLDELQVLCPNVEHVALVTTWFGDDLRAEKCKVRPMVTKRSASPASKSWIVSGDNQATAAQVSRHKGGPAYGGTPADQSVVDAIRELRSRGYKVTLYPFVMMDIPANNSLPNPYGGTRQPPYPWRGRITCDPAPGRKATADKTWLARSQVAAFCGDALPAHFRKMNGTVNFTGPSGDWGYRRMILHYANLAALAGGVDAFLVGSEFRGATTLRDQTNAFPFVEQLVRLAREAKAILGSKTTVTYGADWSEYFGYQPTDGSGDVFFHLDELWSDPAVGAVAIDNYLPLTDWRDSDYGSTNPDGATGPYDLTAMGRAITGGEYFDWYYADSGARKKRNRSPITDGTYDKPWVFRPKDLKSWWENRHVNRIGGVEVSRPTAWVPRSKPIWLSELGCAAVDKGPNQPNVFRDRKSSENSKPYFSSGGRNDLSQRRFIEAHIRHWDSRQPHFAETNNPVSSVYKGRMVDASRLYLWGWDARPFPAFPLNTKTWSDGENWLTGHWLNGRLSSVELRDLINAILADHGLPAADTTGVDGVLSGYLSDNPDSARAALEPLVDLFGLEVREQSGKLFFFNANQSAEPPIVVGDMVFDDDDGVLHTTRLPGHDLPSELVISFRDVMQEYQATSARRLVERVDKGGNRQSVLAFNGMMETSQGEALAADWLARKWTERDTATFRLPASARQVSPGSIVRLPHCGGKGDFIVTGIDDGLTRQIEARRLMRLPPHPDLAALPKGSSIAPADEATRPLALFLDLPLSNPASTMHSQLRVAAWAKPWRQQITSVSPEKTGYSDRSTALQPAVIGVLSANLPPGPSGRTDRANTVQIRLIEGEFASASRLRVLNGANALAVLADNGVWEILQFETAVEAQLSNWRLAGLLRGQLGTEDAALSGSSAGAYAVLLDDAVISAGLLQSEIGLSLNWRVAPSGLLMTKEAAASWTGVGGLRALTPLSPAHLTGHRTSAGDLDFSWIRRGRIDADNWLAAEIPLGELNESYALRITRTDGTVVRAATVTKPSWTYSSAEIAKDFPTASPFDLGVSQISAAVGNGIAATARFSSA